MTLSTSTLSYADVREVLDRAVASQRGVSLSRASHGAAVNFRQRLGKFRLMDRKQSLELYPEGDPRRGQSPYDILVFEVVDKVVFVRKTEVPELEEL